jgi:hypothetical protein
MSTMGKWTKIPENIQIPGSPYNNVSWLYFLFPKFQSPVPVFLPDILVPQGAYKFVAAMDEVIRQLPVQEPTHPGLKKLGLKWTRM